ncbi:MAG TPA: ABC transporter substrate-binding protein [Dermatophilaceae bacterium]|nr:ABC transporter substrate-binding protein [Dermatophilaceae bacterium]
MRGIRAHRRAVAVVLALLVVTGCSRAGQDPPAAVQPPADTPIVVSARASGSRLLPGQATDPFTSRVVNLMFRGLVRHDAKGKAVNEVAESIDTDDSETFRVRLREAWTFSNGDPVTAASFVDAWNAAVRPGSGNRYANAFSSVLGFAAVHGSPGVAPRSRTMTGLTILDPRTFTISLTGPRPGFVNRLAHPAFAPLPPEAFGDPAGFASLPIGNGPYRLEQPWTGGPELTLRPNSSYPGTDRAQNAGLTFRVYPSPGRAYADVQTGRLDVLDGVPVSVLGTFKDEFKLRAVNQPVGVTQSLVFPATSPVWGSPRGRRLRHAVASAINREALSSQLFRGTRQPATDLASPVVEGHSDDACGQDCRFDPALATAALRDAAGPPDGGLIIAYAADGDDLTWVSPLCASITQTLGMPCRPTPVPTQAALATAVAAGTMTSPFVATSTMAVADLSGFLDPRFLFGSTDNDSSYPDRRTQQLLVIAQQTAPGARLPLYQEVTRRVLADLPVVPLWSVNATAVSSQAVKGVKLDVFGVPVYQEITRP